MSEPGTTAGAPVCDARRPSEFCDRRLESVADYVVSVGRVLLEGAAEEVSQVGDMHGRRVLLSISDHDQIARVVSRRPKKQSGVPHPASPYAVPHRDDCPYAICTEQTLSSTPSKPPSVERRGESLL